MKLRQLALSMVKNSIGNEQIGFKLILWHLNGHSKMGNMKHEEQKSVISTAVAKLKMWVKPLDQRHHHMHISMHDLLSWERAHIKILKIIHIYSHLWMRGVKCSTFSADSRFFGHFSFSKCSRFRIFSLFLFKEVSQLIKKNEIKTASNEVDFELFTLYVRNTL